MNRDLEARLVQLQNDNLQLGEEVSSLTIQLSTSQQEAQLADRQLEEVKIQLEEHHKQHENTVWQDTDMCIYHITGKFDLLTSL